MITYTTANQIPLTINPPSAFARTEYRSKAEIAMALFRPTAPLVQLDISPDPVPNTNDPDYQFNLEVWRQQVGYVMFNLAVAASLVIDPELRDKALAIHDGRMAQHADELARLAEVLATIQNGDKVNEYEGYATIIRQIFGGDHPNVRYIIDIACRHSMVDLINVRHMMSGAWEEADVQTTSANF